MTGAAVVVGAHEVAFVDQAMAIGDRNAHDRGLAAALADAAGAPLETVD
jgi:hypothetical protein